MVGSQSGANNAGTKNVFIGYQCGAGAGTGSTGIYNNFLGYQAGFNVTSGSRNTALGSSSGLSLTTG